MKALVIIFGIAMGLVFLALFVGAFLMEAKTELWRKNLKPGARVCFYKHYRYGGYGKGVVTAINPDIDAATVTESQTLKTYNVRLYDVYPV